MTKKTAQFHPKYAFDADDTNAKKILKKNLPKFKKNVRRSVIKLQSTDNFIFDYNLNQCIRQKTGVQNIVKEIKQ